MGPSKQRTVMINTDAVSAFNAARQAITQCGWPSTIINSSCIKASTGISWRSWGETIVVQIQVSGNITYLNVQSELGYGLFDWGKNQNNIDKYLYYLGRLVPISYI